MINKTDLIKVVNKYSGVVGYDIPDLHIHRNFFPNESKDITYEELEKLSYVPGGEVILRDYLEITNKEVANALLHKQPEPEYYYSREDVKNLLLSGSLDQFLDCLDFAPSVVLDMVKELAVELPLNDVQKREAIKEKLNFDVSRIIEIKNTKFDGDEDNANEAASTKTTRRVTTTQTPTATGRRYVAPSKE